MSIRQGQKLIASSTTNGFGLFDCKWADHILNNISWLRADTFSWQSGDVYKAAYEHLLSDFENRSGEMFYAWKSSLYGYYLYTTTTTPDSTTVFYDEEFQVDTEHTFSSFQEGSLSLDDAPEKDIGFERDPSKDTIAPSIDTVGDVSITYYLAQDGHKICLPDQEANLSSLYESTGVAWYYLLDTTNKQFKLPRTKGAFAGYLGNVGGVSAVINGKTLIPDYSTSVSVSSGATSSIYGWFYISGHSYSNTPTVSLNGTKVYTGGYSGSERLSNTCILFVKPGDVISWSGWNGQVSTAKIYPVKDTNIDADEAKLTQMYLYFYVGNYVEDLATIDAGKLAEVVNDFDIDTFKPQVDEVKNEAIVDISDAKTDAIDSLTNLATDLGSSLKYGNVGDIFYTSRLDVSLNGAVECNGNLYNTTDFSGAQSIGNLLRDSKVPYISLAEHQTTVDTYGSCRCFGWDGGTEFRVPKLADVFIEAGVAATEGEFITAGLPDHTHNTPYGKNDSGDHHAQGTSRPHISTNEYYATIRGYSKPSTLASASNAIYGNSTTVQPPAVRYRAMVQLAFGATDDAVVTAGEVVADVSELNSHRVTDFQAPTAENSYKWYRKYADGWIEQGVINVEIATAIYTFNFPVLMANTNYAVITSISDQLNTTSMAAKYSSKATTGVNVRCTYQASSIRGDIMVCGMAA